MINISIAGIGGQGSVLAARILAQAAQAQGWQVRNTETTGMAQRGGAVTSHVRMGNAGEEVFSPLPSAASDDLIIAMEPGEGLRCLPLLKPEGLVVTATSGVAPVTSSFKQAPYSAAEMVAALQASGTQVVVVDDVTLCNQIGNRKVLNIIMLASALVAIEQAGPQSPLYGKLTLESMREALATCVAPRFLKMNYAAIDVVTEQAHIQA